MRQPRHPRAISLSASLALHVLAVAALLAFPSHREVPAASEPARPTAKGAPASPLEERERTRRRLRVGLADAKNRSSKAEGLAGLTSTSTVPGGATGASVDAAPRATSLFAPSLPLGIAPRPGEEAAHAQGELAGTGNAPERRTAPEPQRAAAAEHVAARAAALSGALPAPPPATRKQELPAPALPQLVAPLARQPLPLNEPLPSPDAQAKAAPRLAAHSALGQGEGAPALLEQREAGEEGADDEGREGRTGRASAPRVEDRGVFLARFKPRLGQRERGAADAQDERDANGAAEGTTKGALGASAKELAEGVSEARAAVRDERRKRSGEGDHSPLPGTATTPRRPALEDAEDIPGERVGSREANAPGTPSAPVALQPQRPETPGLAAEASEAARPDGDASAAAHSQRKTETPPTEVEVEGLAGAQGTFPGLLFGTLAPAVGAAPVPGAPALSLPFAGVAQAEHATPAQHAGENARPSDGDGTRAGEVERVGADLSAARNPDAPPPTQTAGRASEQNVPGVGTSGAAGAPAQQVTGEGSGAQDAPRQETPASSEQLLALAQAPAAARSGSPANADEVDRVAVVAVVGRTGDADEAQQPLPMGRSSSPEDGLSTEGSAQKLLELVGRAQSALARAKEGGPGASEALAEATRALQEAEQVQSLAAHAAEQRAQGAGVGAAGAGLVGRGDSVLPLVQQRVNETAALVGGHAARVVGRSGEALVRFHVDERGYVQEVQVLSSSGVRRFDEELHSILHLAEPFPEARGKWVRVKVRFAAPTPGF